MTFHDLLNNELGTKLIYRLLAIDVDMSIAFMISDTPDEIITKIQ